MCFYRLCAGALAWWFAAGMASAQQDAARAFDTARFELQVGEVKILSVPDVARVAVGDGHVLNAVATDEKEVIVFARNPGSSAVHVWSADGAQRSYQIEVLAQSLIQQEAELTQMLARIPGVRLARVGDKLVVEGDALSDADRERVALLAARYPQLLDFTSQVGWDDMVLLDVQVVEIPRTRLRDLGVRWNAASEGGLNAGLAWDAAGRRLLDRPGAAPLPALFPSGGLQGYLGVNALLSSQLDLLAQTGEAVVLAQPQLLARSGATAEFLAGGEVPYTTTDGNGRSNTAFKPYGVSLRITPRIERNGAVRSRIEVEVSSIDPSLSIPTGPSLKTRRAVTEFNVKSGQTLVLAGFISREESNNVDKVPGVGDVPLLGALFRSTRWRNNETELAVFVTPVVVEPDHPDMNRRVAQGQALLDKTFPQTPRLNTPVHQTTVAAPTWYQANGVGSQWQDTPQPVGAWTPGAGAGARPTGNQYDFSD